MENTSTEEIELSVIIPVTERHDPVSKLFHDYKQGIDATGLSHEIIYVLDGEHPEVLNELNQLRNTEQITIITLAKEQGYDVVETIIKIEQLYDADEVFFTGSAAEVTPIREIDDNTIGNGSRGPITEKLQTMYFDLVHGRLDVHQDWLTVVK